MEKVMLSFDKVSAHYGKIQALHEVSLPYQSGRDCHPHWRERGGENHLARHVMRRSARHQRANCV